MVKSLTKEFPKVHIPFPMLESSLAPVLLVKPPRRVGITSVTGGDFDSDDLVTHDDFYFFHECLTNERIGINGGPGNDAGPGCRFADFNADSDTDLSDFADFQNLFTAPQP
jgi:hypothetical protein